MMNKIGRSLTRMVQAPFLMAERRVANMQGPLKQHIDAAEARGEDVCVGVWREYVDLQLHLIPYRVEKLKQECSYLFSGGISLAGFSMADFVLLLRFATRCLFLFIVFVLLGRHGIFPPLAPTSPFVEEVVKRWQPNHIRAFTRPVSDTLLVEQMDEGDLTALQHEIDALRHRELVRQGRDV